MSRAKEDCYFLKDQIKKRKRERTEKILSSSIITKGSLEDSLQFISLHA